jgi:hypothetical protein
MLSLVSGKAPMAASSPPAAMKSLRMSGTSVVPGAKNASTGEGTSAGDGAAVDGVMKMLVSICGKMKVAATRNALPLLEEMPGGGRRRVPATAVEENVSKTMTAGCCLERASSPTAEVAGVS